VATVSVRIGESLRTLNDASDSWVTQQLDGRRADGVQVCACVEIDRSDISLRLTTAACPKYHGAARQLTDREARAVELWCRYGLDKAEPHPHALIAFLQQLRGML
jgi:hypothetical protein